MIDDSDQSLACDLFRRGKFTECCEFLQRISDSHHLEKITHQDEVEFILLRNNLLVCNCLRILSAMDTEYVGKMSELINISELYLHEKHIPLELRVNFVCNALHWYWFKPVDIPDYCYNKIISLVNDCLHEVLHESGKSIINLSSHVGKEQDILNSLECLSNKFLNLQPILVVQCLEISQTLLFVFLIRNCFTSLLVHFTMELIDKIKTIINVLDKKKSCGFTNCFKLGISKINAFLDTKHIHSIIASSHISLCVKNTLDNQHRQALCALSTIDQYIDPKNNLFYLACYLKALVNFNLEDYEVSLYYLSQMTDFPMELFMKSRYYLLLGRTHSKMENNELAVNSFEKLKSSKFNKIMAYHLSQHYETNNMQFTQMLVLEQAIKEDFIIDVDRHEDYSADYTTKVLMTLHIQPDLTKRQLLYLTAKKKYEYSSYKLAASAYLSLLKLNEFEETVSNLVTVPSNFMLQHEAAVALLKANEPEEAFKLCQSLVDEFEPGCGLWKSDLFWADELNDYGLNIVGTMLLAEASLNKNTDVVLEALNKSFNCLYTKINYVTLTETSSYDENIKTLRRILIGKILLLKATVLSRLNMDEDCEATFNKALTFNSGDEDIVYLYSKWLEHKGKTSRSLDVRGQFDKNKTNTLTCNNVVISYVLENKHGLEDTIIGNDVLNDLFASTEEQGMELDNEMDPADDDIFNNLFLD